MESIDGMKDGITSAGKSKGGRNSKDIVKGTTQEGSRFWRNLRILLGCMPLNSKGEDSSSDTRHKGRKFTNDIVRRHQQVSSRSSSSNRSRSCAGSCTHNLSQELLVSSFFRRSCTPDQLQPVNDLQLATRDFRAENFICEVGFGTVLRGRVRQNGNYAAKPEMGTPVVVKSLNLHRFQGYTEWLDEISNLGELHHPNLVELVGFSIHDDKMLLVYEYICRGSLDKHLFRTNVSLPWPIRMKIAIGAAKGLAFLHEEASRPVIFRDFKTSNILLDMNYNAKLSDFGLAKGAPVGDASNISTQVMETQGYAAPEYVMTGHLTSKSDVYSFGVVLLEILTGRKAMEKRMPKKEHNLVEWLHPLLMSKANFNYLMDSRLEGQYSMKGAQMAMRLANHCLRFDPKARPIMSEVVRVLMSLPIHDDMDGQPGPSTSIPSTSVSSTSRQRMHVGLSNSYHGVNKYGLRTSLAPNVPRRFQASPLN